MTVEELITELSKYPKDKIVEIASLTNSHGVAVRVIEYDNFIEIESNETEW